MLHSRKVSWWTFRIFFIFICSGRRKGESEAPGVGGGRFLLKIPGGGVSRRGGAKGGREGVCSELGIWGGGGGGEIFLFRGRDVHEGFFPSPKGPKIEKIQDRPPGLKFQSNQTEERSVHELFAGAFRNKSSMWIVLVFLRKNTRIHKNGRNSWTFRFGPFFGLVCRGNYWVKRDWKFQASHPPNPYSLWGILQVGIANFKRDWFFSIFGPLGFGGFSWTPWCRCRRWRERKCHEKATPQNSSSSSPVQSWGWYVYTLLFS